MHKLQHYEMQGKMNALIQVFFTNRPHPVTVDGDRSRYISMGYGVLQGSLLGLPLSLLFGLPSLNRNHAMHRNPCSSTSKYYLQMLKLHILIIIKVVNNKVAPAALQSCVNKV